MYIYTYTYTYIYQHTYIYIYICIYIYIYIFICACIGLSAHTARIITVSFHDFKSQNFKLSVSNPKSKYVAYLSVLSQISNCQGLGRKNKHDILKTDRIIVIVIAIVIITVVGTKRALKMRALKRRAPIGRYNMYTYTHLCVCIYIYICICMSVCQAHPRDYVRTMCWDPRCKK